jgi:hypothetical protein
MPETNLSFGMGYQILLKILIGLKFDASQIQSNTALERSTALPKSLALHDDVVSGIPKQIPI